MAEIVAHFHGGPLAESGDVRTLDEGQTAYLFIDDIGARSGLYFADEADGKGRCFHWAGWS